MCPRVSNGLTWTEIHELYQLVFDDDGHRPDEDDNPWEPRVNIAPTVKIPVVLNRDGKRIVRLMRWGFIAPWAKTMKDAARMTLWNARSEDVETRKSYATAWRSMRRCIIPVSLFFEWKHLDPEGKKKQPYAVSLNNRGPMSLAGLWTECTDKDTGEHVECCTMFTTAPNSLVADIKDRMPVILDDFDIPAWLNEVPMSPAEAAKIFRPFDAQRMKAWPISSAVGNVKNQGHELLEPIAA